MWLAQNNASRSKTHLEPTLLCEFPLRLVPQHSTIL
jgi:hypothetical protein